MLALKNAIVALYGKSQLFRSTNQPNKINSNNNNSARTRLKTSVPNYPRQAFSFGSRRSLDAQTSHSTEEIVFAMVGRERIEKLQSVQLIISIT